MNKILTLLLSLALISFNTYSFDYESVAEEFGGFGSVQDTLDFICKKSNTTAPALSKNNYQKICKVIRSSETCNKVSKDERLHCNEVDELNIDTYSFSFIYNCFRGLWKSLVNLFEFVVGMVKGSLGYAFDEDSRDKTNKALGEYYDSFTNYLAIEFDKARDETDSDILAMMNVAGDIMMSGMNAISELIKTSYNTLGCYNQEARQARVCEIVGEVIMPPVAAVALIFKGPKYLKKFNSLVNKKIESHKQNKRDRLKLVPSDSKVLTKEARDLTSQEMTSKNIKRLSEKMIATMKVEGGVGLAAPQIGQGLKLIVFKSSKGKNRVMANPVVSFNSAKTKSRTEGCLSLKGVSCTVERKSDISVTYLDLDGKKKTESFSGFDATVIQHETDHINGILFPFQSKTFANKFEITNTDSISKRSLQNLGKFLHTLNDSEKALIKKKYAKALSEDIKDIKNPRSLTSSLKDVKGISTNDDVFNEVLNLYSISVKTSKSSEKLKKYDQWVKSKAHALYLYDNLATLGLKENSDVFRYLSTKNVTIQRNPNKSSNVRP